MKSLLTELENNEAVLLMYLGDELPEEDRVEVEHLLEGDSCLRREFERLRGDWQRIGETLAAGDGTRNAARHAAAARRAADAIHRWSRERILHYAAPERRRWKIPSWTYPAAAAAMLLVSFFVWWSKQADDFGPVAGSMRMTDPLYPGGAMPYFGPSDDRYATAANAGMDGISRLERQLDAVEELSEMVR